MTRYLSICMVTVSLFGSCMQDLSRITMPVSVNEPLSFLQRMVEYLEYSELLSAAAAQTDDPLHRLEVSCTHSALSLIHSFKLPSRISLTTVPNIRSSLSDSLPPPSSDVGIPCSHLANGTDKWTDDNIGLGLCPSTA